MYFDLENWFSFWTEQRTLRRPFRNTRFRVQPFHSCRQKATECLFVMAGHAVGRDAFLENEIIIPVSKLFDDPVDIARKNAHKVRLKSDAEICQSTSTATACSPCTVFLALGYGNDCRDTPRRSRNRGSESRSQGQSG